MRRKLAYAGLALGLAWIHVIDVAASVRAENGHVALLSIDGAIDPVSARYLSRGVGKATDGGASLVVIELDTPGGLLSSTRDMTESILSAEIPVAVYVSPPGARAASAGTFIASAANFAVMAPATNIGAASPVAAGGEDIPPTLAKKVNEDTRAFIRSIASKRNRNAEALEETVTHARSYSADEAVELGVVDFIANDLTGLLEQLDGLTAETAAGPVVLKTRGVEVREIIRTFLERFLGVLANPNLAFALMSIGSLALLAEFMTPGSIGPGVVGVIALALAFVGLGNLPVNWAAVGLILFSMILFYVELQAPGLPIFGIGGLIAFVLGALLLFGGFSPPDISEPGFGVSRWLIGVLGGMVAGLLVTFFYLMRDTGSPTGYVSDSEGAIVGKRGKAISDLSPTGAVRVAGQDWTATADPGVVIREGDQVWVLGEYGDVLKVSKTRPGRRVKKRLPLFRRLRFRRP